METCLTDLRRIRTSFPPKPSLRGCQVGSADPPLAPFPTDLRWFTALWVLMSDGRCRDLVDRFGLVCGPPLLMLHRTRSSATSVCVFIVFSSYYRLLFLKS